MISETFSPPPIESLDAALRGALRTKVDGLAKPLGSLGRLEDLAVQIGAIQGRLDPHIERIRAYIFAGDHGLNAEGVSAYPSSVTAAMVTTFLAGRASVNALAKVCGVELLVVDAGVDADLPPHPDLLSAKVRRGSRNAMTEPALTEAEVDQALNHGVALAKAASADGIDVLIPGEMGIGNTASASLIMHRLAPAALADCIGAGAGGDAPGQERKARVLAQASARTDVTSPLDVLSQFGGLEIVMMAGLILGGAAHRKVIMVDGFISSAAALVAIRLAPRARDYCVFAHASAEHGHALLLRSMQVEPLLHLGMRLGEGTGAVLAAPLVRAAASMLTDVASLDDVLSGRL